MNFFKKHGLLFLILILFCTGLLALGRTSVGKKIAGIISAKKALFGKKIAEEQAVEELIPARTTIVVKMDYKDTITSFGTIKGFGEIPIRFKESGMISKFYFKEGDIIKKDELVVSQNQDVENIKLEYAKIEYTKNEKLFILGAITEDKLKQGKLELESAQLELKKRNFYAPTDGLMGTRNVTENELAEPNDVVATFLDISKVFCEVGIIEKEMGKVKAWQKAKVIIDVLPDLDNEGIVDSVSPMLEGRSRTQTVKVLFSNSNGLIKPGMFAKAEIVIFEKKDAIVIPRKALNKAEEGYVALGVVRPEGEVKKTAAGFEEAAVKVIPVKVERATEEVALIGEGLTEGQEIVVESPQAKAGIKDGSKIEILGAEEEAPPVNN